MVLKTPSCYAYFSCTPPILNFLELYFIFMHMHYNHCHRATAHLQLNLLLLSLLSPVCRVFTLIYLKQTMFLEYIVLQLFFISSLLRIPRVCREFSLQGHFTDQFAHRMDHLPSFQRAGTDSSSSTYAARLWRHPTSHPAGTKIYLPSDCQTDHSTPPGAQAKNAGSSNSISPVCCLGAIRHNQTQACEIRVEK
jgi:hypothetical protein